MNITITKNPNPATPPTENFGFGSTFTPHMFRMDYSDGQWKDPRIVPYGPFSLDPASKVLHYGQEIFEGMKAYRNKQDGSVHMFRPDRNIARFQRSCERMCMPVVDPDIFMRGLNMLIDLDRAWAPESPNALYIRPTMIATQVGLGVKASTDYIFFIIIGPVGSYFAHGINPLRLKVEEKYVRSAHGGTGSAKTGGNYSASLLPIKQAQDAGYDNIIWLDAKTNSFVEEMGAMNIMFVYEDKVITAPAGDTILHGVTRESIGTLLGDFGLNWVEEHPPIAQVMEDAHSGKLKEVFACGTAAVVTPVGTIHFQGADHTIGDGNEGPLTNKLRVALTGIHSGGSERHPEWVFKVPEQG
ncbi:branched-chain amino acid aminotransferase [bacterium]|nr:branched-chain amino acid aminotransferase [bacterium]PIV81125.1 MAG: branched chain amino acid aminotransferase [bacterium CG17_big_fil_post_rev_8_21_14_2_50_64_8]PJA75862.1 MAG: branched chain amino acid aminotransferase [bacterium CG_4_9_14_3_um_filter_65_15]